MGQLKNNHQKFHFKAILGSVGLLLHVPGIMALISLLIALIYNEFYAILPFLSVGVAGIVLGQVLFRVFYHPEVIRLWDGMITAALGLIACSFLAALPFYFITLAAGNNSSLGTPLNALFESVSGFTSTGLTMVERPSLLPHTMQWWRSFLEWVGGIGLVIFVISTIKAQREEFTLYYAETKRYRFGRNIRETTRIIWTLYSVYTVFGVILLLLSGMTIWDALNHAMTGLATGGFSTSDLNLGGFSTRAQCATLIVMALGTISFPVHYAILREGNFSALWRDMESRLLLIFFAAGTLIIALLNLWTGAPIRWFDSLFQWVSCLGTCGFSTTHMTSFAPIVRLFFIFGMVIGGPSDATTGGINIRRFKNLMANLFLPFTFLSRKKEKKALKQIAREQARPKESLTDILLPFSEKRRKLHSAAIVCILWIFFLLLGWFFLLKWVPNSQSLDALFDAASALGNVGLSTGVTSPELFGTGKVILICLMWLGRLEIVPILLCLFSVMIWTKRLFHAKH